MIFSPCAMIRSSLKSVMYSCRSPPLVEVLLTDLSADSCTLCYGLICRCDGLLAANPLLKQNVCHSLGPTNHRKHKHLLIQHLPKFAISARTGPRRGPQPATAKLTAQTEHLSDDPFANPWAELLATVSPCAAALRRRPRHAHPRCDTIPWGSKRPIALIAFGGYERLGIDFRNLRFPQLDSPPLPLPCRGQLRPPSWP